MNSTVDTAPIRPGEELNLNALETYLRERLPDLWTESRWIAPTMTVEQFRGHSNLTYLVGFGPRQFVLRRPPFGPVAPTAHDMPREYRLLVAVHPVFPLAPRPYLLCEDASIVGAAFYLMERRNGMVIRRDLPEEIGGDLDLRRRVGEAMVDTLAALHSVDIYSSDVVGIGKPIGFVTRQVRGWTDRWHRAKTANSPKSRPHQHPMAQ
jgi:aminoglycoside phosphotransferase (APT) family kinase protein